MNNILDELNSSNGTDSKHFYKLIAIGILVGLSISNYKYIVDTIVESILFRFEYFGWSNKTISELGSIFIMALGIWLIFRFFKNRMEDGKITVNNLFIYSAIVYLIGYFINIVVQTAYIRLWQYSDSIRKHFTELGLFKYFIQIVDHLGFLVLVGVSIFILFRTGNRKPVE